MAQLNALFAAEALRKRLVDYAQDELYVRDSNLHEACAQIWSQDGHDGGLLSDIWIEATFASESSTKTLDSLAQQGRFSAILRDQLHDSNQFPKTRLLFKHQLEAIELARQTRGKPVRPAMLITAGTGAGKTESFQFPLLDELLDAKQRKEISPNQGSSVFIIYPMNALVNDQVARLYRALEKQNTITFFHFTSETPEDDRAASKSGIPKWQPCRIRTREKARENPPDIVITNYSMLEYMLSRPQDRVFFGKNLRAVVLDEAHLYTGTLAAEITLLLRRLCLRCRVPSEKLLAFGTSATIGSENDEPLVAFAQTVFSKSREAVRVIRGKRVRIVLGEISPPDKPTDKTDLYESIPDDLTTLRTADEQSILVEDAVQCDLLARSLVRLASEEVVQQARKECEDKPALMLHTVLRHAPIVHQATDLFWSLQASTHNASAIELSDLAQRLWGSDDDQAKHATLSLLNISAAARANANDLPLIPHRIHLMVRSPDGLSVCLNPHCTHTNHFPGAGALLPGFIESCPSCKGMCLPLYRCDDCGQHYLVARVEAGELRPPFGGFMRSWEPTSIISFVPLPPDADSNLAAITRLRFLNSKGKLSNRTGSGMEVWVSELGSEQPSHVCYSCGASPTKLKPFTLGSNLTQSIAVETLLGEIPPMPSRAAWLPAGGRRLLAFSDSRRNAARLGPVLSQQHETQVVRAAILNSLSSSPMASDATLRDAYAELADIRKKLKASELEQAQQDRFRRREQFLQREIQEMQVGGSVKEYANRLKSEPLLAQLNGSSVFSVDGSRQDIWNQTDWEKNYSAIRKESDPLFLRELVTGSPQNATLETLGLIELTYPGIELLQIPTGSRDLVRTQANFERLRSEWTNILASLCDTVRYNYALCLKWNDDKINDYMYGPEYIGYWCSKQDGGTYLVGFVGTREEQQRSAFMSAILEGIGIDSGDVASKLLALIFDQLLDYAVPHDQNATTGKLAWLRKRDTQIRGRSTKSGVVPSIQIDLWELGLRRPSQWYRCRKKGLVFPRSVMECGPYFGCERTLEAVTNEDLDQDPRIGRRRREFQSSPIFKMALWAEEHSAQLSPEYNQKLQRLFIEGARNVLSATTTMEVGIDIGGLSAVFMSNVPPSKANYLQRAGRAGRRSDGSSLVLTFAHNRPYDREVFDQIGKFLGKSLRDPHVFLNRKRIVQRHINALLLGTFFTEVVDPTHRRGAMDAFGNMGGFCGEEIARKWESGLPKPPLVRPDTANQVRSPLPEWWNTSVDDLRHQFLNFLTWTTMRSGIKVQDDCKSLVRGLDFAINLSDWHGYIDATHNIFEDAVKQWVDDYSELKKQWPLADTPAQANRIYYQLKERYQVTVIEALADRQFLPRYGFPIGVHALKVRLARDDKDQTSRIEDQFRLERPSLLALREYAPGCSVVVGGQTVTSRGLLKHWTGSLTDAPMGMRGHASEGNDGNLYYSIVSENKLDELLAANHTSAKTHKTELLLPRYGFSTAAWEKPRRARQIDLAPEVYIATTAFAQGLQNDDPVEEFNDLAGVPDLIARYRQRGELLVYNKGTKEYGYAVCTECGYADSEDSSIGNGRERLPRNFERHWSLEGVKSRLCWKEGQAPVLRHQWLAATQTTDVLLVDFSHIWSPDQCNDTLMWTLGHALRLSAARTLELDTRELGITVLSVNVAGARGIVLYDNVPGGAGHVREVVRDAATSKSWFEVAHDEILFINKEHDARCKTACMDCLLTFESQTDVMKGRINRQLALAMLRDLPL